MSAAQIRDVLFHKFLTQHEILIENHIRSFISWKNVSDPSIVAKRLGHEPLLVLVVEEVWLRDTEKSCGKLSRKNMV